jgi:dGTPase
LERQAASKPAVADAIASLGGLCPEVAEAAGLAHDLGHPPFGHVAEKALDRLVVEAGVSDGYEGNAQSFRILTALAPHPESPLGGANLSRAALRAVLKYPWPRELDPATGKPSNGDRAKKWGSYGCDKADFDFAMELAVQPGNRGSKNEARSLEAEIMDWADDVTYALHDLDDFYRAGLIPLEAVFTRDSHEQAGFVAFAAKKLASSWQTSPQGARSRCEEALKLVSALLKLEPFEGTQDQLIRIHGLMGQLISLFFGAFQVGAENQSLVYVSPPIRDAVDVLKQLTWHYVILRPALATQQEGQVKAIEFLYRFYLQRLNKPEDSPLPIERLVPSSLTHYLDTVEGVARPHNARLAADIIASLTEDEALMLYGRLTGYSTGSLVDRLPI